MEKTYDHANSDLLSVVLLLHRLVENNVQEDLISLASFLSFVGISLTS
jgi:hypothetical protein